MKQSRITKSSGETLALLVIDGPCLTLLELLRIKEDLTANEMVEYCNALRDFYGHDNFEETYSTLMEYAKNMGQDG